LGWKEILTRTKTVKEARKQEKRKTFAMATEVLICMRSVERGTLSASISGKVAIFSLQKTYGFALVDTIAMLTCTTYNRNSK
jgi:hypothetical protein